MSGLGQIVVDEDSRWSWPVNIAATAFLSIALVLHIWQPLRYGFRFCWSCRNLWLGIIFMIVGYVFRFLHNIGPGFLSNWLQFHGIVIGPTFIIFPLIDIVANLATHRQLHQFAPRFSMGGPATYCNFIAFIVLNCGPLYFFINNEKKKGLALLLAGFCLQSLALLLVLISHTVLCIRARGFMWEKQQHQLEEVQNTVKKVKSFVIAVWLSILLLSARTLFRLADTAIVLPYANSRSYYANISLNEVYFIVFESAPVVIAIWLLGVWHLGSIFCDPDWKAPETETQAPERETQERERQEREMQVRETQSV